MERTIKPEDFAAAAKDAMVLDVRRREDFAASGDKVPGAEWKDPAQVEQWATTLPPGQEVILYCVRGGGVSNSVVDRLQAAGMRARFIEGGIEGLKAAGGTLERK